MEHTMQRVMVVMVSNNDDVRIADVFLLDWLMLMVDFLM